MTDWEGTCACRKKIKIKPANAGNPREPFFFFFFLKCKGRFECMLSLAITSITAAKNKHYSNTMEFTSVRRHLTAVWYLYIEILICYQNNPALQLEVLSHNVKVK